MLLQHLCGTEVIEDTNAMLKRISRKELLKQEIGQMENLCDIFEDYLNSINSFD